MTEEQYLKEQEEIEEKYKISIHKLRKKYIEDNAEFKVGDYIYNVTGIIKIDRIGYNICKWSNSPEIIYYGLRYKKMGGELFRTKDKKESSLQYNLKKVKL